MKNKTNNHNYNYNKSKNNKDKSNKDKNNKDKIMIESKIISLIKYRNTRFSKIFINRYK
jgi:hypothetical protein